MTKCYILIDNTSVKNKLVNFFESNDIDFQQLKTEELESFNESDFSHNALFIDSENLDQFVNLSNNKSNPLLRIILLQNNSDKTISKKLTNSCDLIINLPLNKAKLSKTYNFINEFNTLNFNNENINTFDYGNYLLEGTSQTLNNFKQELKLTSKSSENIFISGGIGTEKLRILNFIIENIRNKNEKVTYCRCKQIVSCENPKLELQNLFKRLKNTSTNNSLVIIYQPYHLDAELQTELKTLLEENKNIQYFTVSQFTEEALISEYNFDNNIIDFLSQNSIKIPSLTKRKHDIPHIVDFLNKRLISIYGCQDIKFSTTALITLQSYEWPGNYIELRNIIESLVINAVENQIETIESKDLPSDLFIVNQASINPSVNHDIMSKDLKEARSIFEKQYIEAQIRRFGGNVSHTANFIGMERTALHRKLSYLGIMSDDLRSSIKGYRRSSNNN
ncbi:MAG: hypothetical protein ISQ32_03980 [Rickettsiales bacterium]|nr:hypothetical protein [Rickettsiales bacterium]